ncbi:MAG: RNA polymerase sigma factor [Planctomycetota bacterium]
MNTDIQLLQRYVEQGDKTAFETLLARHYPAVYQTVLHLVHNSFDANDLTQSTFLKVIEFGGSYKPLKPFRNWVLTIAVNEVRQFRRKKRARPEGDWLFEQLADSSSGSDRLDDLSRREFEQALEQALEDLPEKFKEPLVLHYYQGLSLAEIADVLGLPKTTVQYRLEGGIGNLRGFFKSKGYAALIPLLGKFLPELATASNAASGLGTGGGTVFSLLTKGVIAGVIAMKTKTFGIALLVSLLLLAGGVTGHYILVPASETLVDPQGFPKGEEGEEAIPDLTGEREAAEHRTIAGERLPAPENPLPPSQLGEDLIIRGRIEDLAGNPVSGARVLLGPGPERGNSINRRLGGAFEQIEGRYRFVHPNETTAGDGSFRFPGLKPGIHILATRPRGYLEAWKVVTLREGTESPEIVLKVSRGLAVSGRVVDMDTGAGVEGIPIYGRQSAPKEYFSKWRRQETVSGPNGAFTLDGFLPRQVTVYPRIPKNREITYLPERTRRGDWDRESRLTVWGLRFSKIVEAGASDVVFRVFPRGSVEFQAVEKETRRHIFARIEATLAAPQDNFPRIWMRGEGEGKYVMTAPAGERSFILKAEGFQPCRVDIRVHAHQRTLRLEPIEFESAGSLPAIDGVVTTRLPVEKGSGWGVCVYYEECSAEKRRIQVAHTGKVDPRRNRYRIPLQRPGKYRLVAFATGHVPYVLEVSVGDTGCMHDFFLEKRTGTTPPPRPQYTYKECREIEVALCVEDVPFPELIELLVAVTGAKLAIREGTDLGESTDPPEMGGICWNSEPRPLSETITFFTKIFDLRFDKEKGEFYSEE